MDPPHLRRHGGRRGRGSRLEARLGRTIGGRYDEVVAANKNHIAIHTPQSEIRYGALGTLCDRIAAALPTAASQARYLEAARAEGPLR